MQLKVKSTEEIKQFWDDYAESYLHQDNALNGFYFTLINMLKIEKKKSILEVGAGGGYLYNHSLNRKHPDASYYATDLSDSMLSVLCRRMGVEYIQNETIKVPRFNLFIERANAENLPFKDENFDCYISNLCLHIVTHPEKMIQESFRVLQKGGYAGFTVWGDKAHSKFFAQVPLILNQQFGIEIPQVRSSFHLNDRALLIKMMESQGFINIISWNQFQPFPLVDVDDFELVFNFLFVQDTLKKCGDKQEQVKQALFSAYKSYIIDSNEPIGLDGLMIIAKKPL